MKRNIYLSKRQLVIGDLGHARNYINSKSVVTRGLKVGTSGYIAPEIITSTLNCITSRDTYINIQMKRKKKKKINLIFKKRVQASLN
jgi:serine/threonine protein kinase